MHSLRLKALITALLGAALLIPTALLDAPMADADSKRGSRTQVIGRGDILTTILAQSKSPRRTGKPRTKSSCRDIKFNDAEIEMLVAIIGFNGDESQIVKDLFRDYLVADPSPSDPALSDPALSDAAASDPALSEFSGLPSPDDFDIVARRCDREIVDIRAVPRSAATSLSGGLVRSMITRLPAPVVVQSPPPGKAVPINQPVFVSVDPDNWREIRKTLVEDGVVAEVRARPVGLRTYTGEPMSPFVTCDGPGRRFDPSSTLSARAQSRAPEACTMDYRLATRKGGTGTSQPAWLGSISVLWQAEWRMNEGPWRSLDPITRTHLFERTTVEVRTSITRTGGPILAAIRGS